MGRCEPGFPHAARSMLRFRGAPVTNPQNAPRPTFRRPIKDQGPETKDLSTERGRPRPLPSPDPSPQILRRQPPTLRHRPTNDFVPFVTFCSMFECVEIADRRPSEFRVIRVFRGLSHPAPPREARDLSPRLCLRRCLPPSPFFHEL